MTYHWSNIKKEILTELRFSSRCFQMCMGIYSKWLLWWWWKCNDNNTAVKLQQIRTSQNDLRCQLCQHKNCALHMKQNICKQVAIKTQTILPRNTSITRDCSGNFHQSKSTLIRGVYHQVPASAKLQYTKTHLVQESPILHFKITCMNSKISVPWNHICSFFSFTQARP